MPTIDMRRVNSLEQSGCLFCHVIGGSNSQTTFALKFGVTSLGCDSKVHPSRTRRSAQTGSSSPSPGGHRTGLRVATSEGRSRRQVPSRRKPFQSWSAISRTPYLTALALWPKGDGWGQLAAKYRANRLGETDRIVVHRFDPATTGRTRKCPAQGPI
jgi:hypothetical protein